MEVVEDDGGAVLGDRRQLAKEHIDHFVASRPAGLGLTQHRRGPLSKVGFVLAARCDQVREEGAPAAILRVHPVPQGPQVSPPREVSQQRRLAIAGLGDDEHDAVVDLDVQPIEKPMAGEGFLPQQRSLDLPRLDREPAHDTLRCPSDEGRRFDRRSARTDGYRSSDRSRRVGTGDGMVERTVSTGRRERYGAVAQGVNNGEPIGPGHAPHSDRRGLSGD